MMIGVSLYRQLLITFLFVLGIVACSEPQAAPTDYGTTTDDPTGGDDNNGDDDDGDDDLGDGGSSTSSYDICDDLTNKSGLSKWEDYVEELCDDKKLITLRQSKNVYKGGSDAKVLMTGEEENDKEISFKLFISSLVPTSADKYYEMMRLQFFEPSKFDKEFERDPFLETYKILDDDDNSVKYRYVNTREEASNVDYEAESKFFTLKKGQSYVVATKLTKSNETMVDLEALILINGKSSSKTEVFVISYQTYDRGDQLASVARKNARESLEEEQIRSYKNAEKADDYFD